MLQNLLEMDKQQDNKDKEENKKEYSWQPAIYREWLDPVTQPPLKVKEKMKGELHSSDMYNSYYIHVVQI